MKNFFYAFGIIIAFFIFSCRSKDVIAPDTTLCSGVLKLDTVWQVKFDTNTGTWELRVENK